MVSAGGCGGGVGIRICSVIAPFLVAENRQAVAEGYGLDRQVDDVDCAVGEEPVMNPRAAKDQAVLERVNVVDEAWQA